MGRFIAAAAACALLLALPGCYKPGTEVFHQPSPGIGLIGNYVDDQKKIAVANSNALTLYAHEARYFQGGDPTRPRPPKLCVALSGGGLRSASFSMGVLAGLHAAGRLLEIDAISGVSGGAYALSWFYAQQLNYWEASGRKRLLPLETLFDTRPGESGGRDPGGAVASLDRVARKADLAPPSTFGGGVLDATMFGPVNLVANGLFGLHANTSIASQGYYESKLRELFLGDENIEMPRLKEFLDETRTEQRPPRRLPLPIINTTATFDDDLQHRGAILGNTRFEFTPDWYGSDGIGYGEYSHAHLPLAEIVAASGAAVDLTTQASGNGRKLLASLANADLGRYMPSPNPELARRSWEGALPFPIYLGMPNYNREADGFAVYLTDGGHSENLGAFALIRRLCDRILIVDAEHDPNYEFDAYFKLKKRVRQELSANLSIAELDDRQFVDESRTLEADKRSPAPDLLSRAAQRIESFFGIGGELSRRRWYDPEGRVLEGTIREFPLRDGGTKTLEVAYLKLSIDPERDSAGSRFVAQRYRERRDEWPKGYWDAWSYPFPQESTIDQDFSYDQFRAYSDLGYGLVRRYLDGPNILAR